MGLDGAGPLHATLVFDFAEQFTPVKKSDKAIHFY